MLNSIGQGAGSSGQNAAVQIDRVRSQDSAGSVATSTTDYNGNALIVYKAVPTLAMVAVNTATKVVNGTAREVYKFTISAPASTVSANGIAVKQVRLPVTWNDGGAAGDALEVESLRLLVDGSDVTTSDVTLQDGSGASVESTSGLLEDDAFLVISWDASKELAIGAGQTRTLTVRGVPQGFNVLDTETTPTDSVGFALLSDTAAQTAAHTYLNGGTGATVDMCSSTIVLLLPMLVVRLQISSGLISLLIRTLLLKMLHRLLIGQTDTRSTMILMSHSSLTSSL
jgi:hypothetical protein